MVTLITGASTGIGAEFARQFAALGHDLVVVARSADRLEELAAGLRTAHGVDVTVIAMDLAKPTAAAELWQRTSGLGLEVDVLVNNAGFGTHSDVAEADPERLEEEVELNCRTLVGTTARYLPPMRARGSGSIVNVASTAAFQPLPQMAVYAATKAFVLSFTEAVWAEERKHGVRVLAVCPGLTDTPFFELAGGAAATAASGTAARTFTRTPQQVVAHTIRALSGRKPSFVDGLANAVVIRGLNRVLPRRLVIAVSGRLIGG
jgi:short-subunit dehydrogenase